MSSLKKIFLLMILSLNLGVQTLWAQDLTDIQAQKFMDLGNYWYQHRSDESSGDMAKPTNILKSIAAYKQAKNNPKYEKQAYLSLMDAWVFQASHAFKSQSESYLIFKKSSEIAKKMTKKYPQEAGFYYWYALFYSLWIKEKNIFIAIKDNAANGIKNALEKSIKLNPNFKNGIAYLNLGALYHKLPKVPFISPWASSSKAEEFLKLAEKTLSDDFYFLYLKAHYYYDEGDYKVAEKVCKNILRRNLRLENVLEDRRTQWRTYALLKEVLKELD